MMMNKDMEDYDFLIEMQQLHHQMEMLIEKYGMRDRVMSVVVTGVLEPIDDDTSSMKALFSYNLNNTEEMEEMVNFIQSTFKEREDDDPDLDGLIDGLGISLN
jgi:hypothetical protein